MPTSTITVNATQTIPVAVTASTPVRPVLLPPGIMPQYGNVPMVATTMPQYGTVAMPGTTMPQYATVPMAGTAMPQYGTVPIAATSMPQYATLPMPPTSMPQYATVPMPPTSMAQYGTVPMPATTMAQFPTVPMPPTSMNVQYQNVATASGHQIYSDQNAFLGQYSYQQVWQQQGQFAQPQAQYIPSGAIAGGYGVTPGTYVQAQPSVQPLWSTTLRQRFNLSNRLTSQQTRFLMSTRPTLRNDPTQSLPDVHSQRQPQPTTQSQR